MYILAPHPFPTVDSFVHSSSAHYHLHLTRYQLPLKPAFSLYLQEHPAVKCIFVGTRRTDPHGGGLSAFDPTDGGWPAFMRCHPVLEWGYGDVWTVSLYFFLLVGWRRRQRVG